MTESAVPLVDVPAASSTVLESSVTFDETTHQLTLELGVHAQDHLDDLFDEVSDALGIDGSDAIRIHVDGSGTRSAPLRALIQFISHDCDRPIQAVQLTPQARDALLQDAVGRAVQVVEPTSAPICTTPPPVRPLLALADAIVDVPEPESTHAPEPAEAVAEEVAVEVEAAAVEAVAVIEDVEVEAAPDEPAVEEDEVPVLAEEPEEEPDDAGPPASAEELPHSRPWGATTDGDRRVLALRRTLRSGKIVRFAGDVVVFGDINAGAQVVADGDIVVLGRLRGIAHAGMRGDDTAVVVGLDMQSGQVRIGDIIAFPRPAPPAAGSSRLAALLRRAPTTPNRSVSPSVARVVDGEIRIEDYRGRLHA